MKRLLSLALFAGLVMMPAVAQANAWFDDFNDGSMDAQWSMYPSGIGSDAVFTEAPVSDYGVLNFTVSTFDSGGEGMVDYFNNQQVGFSQDFRFKTQFVNNVSGGSEKPLADLLFGLTRNTSPAIFAYASIWNDNTGAPKFTVLYDTSDDDDAIYMSPSYNRPADHIWVGMEYLAGTDTLRFGTSADGDTWTILDTYDGFTAISEIGTDSMNPFLGAYSHTTQVTMGQMTFDNFQGNVVPEPVSSALFLLGSAVLGIKRLRKRAA